DTFTAGLDGTGAAAPVGRGGIAFATSATHAVGNAPAVAGSATATTATANASTLLCRPDIRCRIIGPAGRASPLLDGPRARVAQRAGRVEQLPGLEQGLQPGQDHRPAAVQLRVG